MLLAVLLICPLGVAGLFAFARFADRNFRDSLPAPRRAFLEAKITAARSARVLRKEPSRIG
ncbi:hypothetical protein [Caballeronia hypogeia]|uniref:hypothetical protein n=1 Tax=Caballeronia hypogeia TaxID=1777140 RepID=UPI000A409BAB|nr:hypothetical protein [Caballeronia hypogeia]